MQLSKVFQKKQSDFTKTQTLGKLMRTAVESDYLWAAPPLDRTSIIYLQFYERVWL
jgi:hypothetical protein